MTIRALFALIFALVAAEIVGCWRSRAAES